MDEKTIQAYDEQAEEIAKLHAELKPVRLYELTQKFFNKSELTLDLGCGIGRDTQWLHEQGYEVLGLDASEGMLNVARQNYPQLNFLNDSLPELSTQSDTTYSNVFCSAVLMHLPQEKLEAALDNILRITKSCGKIIISIRANENEREKGKLYTSIIPDILVAYAKTKGGKLLLSVENYEEDRKITWDSFVFEKLN